jgi:hypothetical protein
MEFVSKFSASVCGLSNTNILTNVSNPFLVTSLPHSARGKQALPIPDSMETRVSGRETCRIKQRWFRWHCSKKAKYLHSRRMTHFAYQTISDS